MFREVSCISLAKIPKKTARVLARCDFRTNFFAFFTIFFRINITGMKSLSFRFILKSQVKNIVCCPQNKPIGSAADNVFKKKDSLILINKELL